MNDAARSRTIRFDAFEVDVRNEQLRKDGIRIRLHHQPFRLLIVLLEHAGDVVTREELRRELWGSQTFVDFEIGLNSTVKKLRAALGDSADVPRFIETVPRVGYRFVAPTTVEPPAATASVKSSRSWQRASGAALLIAVTALVALVAMLRSREPARTRPIRSIAVLPFENLSGDAQHEHFAEGITDALTTELAQLAPLRVMSRTSAERLQQLHKTLRETAGELNIDAVVEGTVVRSDDRVRIDVRLIEAATDRSLWAGSYERDLSQAADVQTEIARGIADALRLELSPQEKERLARGRSVDPETYELYLRGRYFLDKWSDRASDRSIEYFNEALGRDKQYALAYVGLATAYIDRQDMSPREAYARSKAAAVAALQIDPALPEAHSVLAMSLFLYDWNWPAAEKEFQRAIAGNPNDAMAHQWYGQFQKAMGRASWVGEVRRAHELDPLSVIIAGAGQYRASGRNDLAIENMRKKIELDPNVPGLYDQLGDVYLRMRRYTEAAANYRKAFEVSGEGPRYLAMVGYSEALAGKRIEANEVLRQLEQVSKRRYVSAYDVALVHIGLGESDAAFDWLQKAVTERATHVVFLNWDDHLDSIRSDPRFAALARRVGLPH